MTADVTIISILVRITCLKDRALTGVDFELDVKCPA